MNDHDDVRRIVSSSDPVSDLPPLRDDQRHRLMENAMTYTTPQDATSPPSDRRRGIVLGLVVGLSVAGAAALAIPLVVQNGGGQVTALSQPPAGGPASMCAEVTADAIADADAAFRATVTGISGETVTLDVTDRFVGDVGDVVEVPQGSDNGIDGEPLTFTAGQTYLISTSDDTIRSCGLSGPESPELADLFAAAGDQ